MKNNNSASIDVWMIIASFYPHIGGAEQQAQRLSTQLRKQGWRIAVMTRRHNPRYPFSPPACETIDTVPIHRVFSAGPSKMGSIMFVVAGLWYLLRNGRSQVYHAHDIGAPALLSVLAKLLLGGHSLVKIRSSPDRVENRLRHLLGSLHIAILRRYVDRFIVVSRDAESFLTKYGVSARKIAYIPNGVDTNYYRPALPGEKIVSRRKLQLDEDKTVFLFVGRLVPEKGVDILLKAWAQLPEKHHPHLLLLIVGVGPQEQMLKLMAQKLGIDDSVRFDGRQENVRDYLHAADLFVLPSRSEGLSNALLEAMACGLPIICSAVGGALELVLPGTEGVLFRSEDSVDLARLLVEMVESKNFWPEMGNAARLKAEQHVSLQNIGRRFAEQYRIGFRI